jgi:hypothetical protein
MEKISKISPIVTVTAPPTSIELLLLVLRLSGKTPRTGNSMIITIGMFSRKIHRHPSSSVISPPPAIPTTKPKPAIAPYAARARLRALPAAKFAISSERELGTKAATPRPE